MKKLKVMTVFGTRPEAIKMGPLIKELKKHESIDTIVCVTAQHRQILDQVLELFHVSPHFDLDIMEDRQTLADITTKVLEGLSAIFQQVKPDIVLVHGDTTTTFSGSLAAFYNKITVGHVEAGLRTYNKYFPYPEEINRKLTGVLSDLHFSPTLTNKSNLINEGVEKEKIYVTGNTVIDALKTTVNKDYRFSNRTLRKMDFLNKKVITVTAHRRENLGKPLENICRAVRFLAEKYHDLEIVYPVHPNPMVGETAKRVLGNHNRIHLVAPLDVQEMHNLMDRSFMIMTDSGGLQEEAPSLGKPVLVLRNETERPEAVKAGTVKIAGTHEDKIISLAAQLIEDDKEYRRMAKALNPYGDGNASRRIVQAILYEFGLSTDKPEDFSYNQLLSGG